MKPVRSVKNQYLGINAHLHSLLQAEGGWGGFHTRQIVHLADVLAAQLLSMGYVAEIEESLQIRRLGDLPEHPRADVLISDVDLVRPMGSAVRSRGQRMPVAELLAENELSETPFRAISIRPVEVFSGRRGEPVAWIELLSPTNKGSSEDAEAYRTKRMNLMVGGLVFVELDYLHETAPTFPTILSYRSARGQQHPEAHPYRIIVIDPRPMLERGEAQVEEFDVDALIPTLDIPLNAGDILPFDFGVPYRKTFAEGLVGSTLDYSQLPLNFDRYSRPDQARIAARLLAVLEAASSGVDLETGPFPVKPVSLDEALAQVEALVSQL